MVAAYNTFPSRGVYISPQFVTRIEDNQGNVLGEFTNRKREAISEQTAYLMENLMQAGYTVYLMRMPDRRRHRRSDIASLLM